MTTSLSPNRPVGSPASGTPSATAPGLDAAALARLQELDPDGRNGVVQRVLEAYENSLVRMLQQLHEQRGGHDAALVGRLAHTLKSSSGSVGALGMAQACADVEARLRNGAPGELAHDVDRLLAEGQVALASVAAMLRPNDQS